MHIVDKDLYYGAALKQIADHKLFKSINAEWHGNKKSSCAFRVNIDIGVYIRHAKEPNNNGEYVFNFKKEHVQEIDAMKTLCPNKTFIVFVCYSARETCVLTIEQLEALLEARNGAVNGTASQHNVLITVRRSKRIRALVTVPGRKNQRIKLTRTIPRNAFPKIIFQ